MPSVLYSADDDSFSYRVGSLSGALCRTAGSFLLSSDALEVSERVRDPRLIKTYNVHLRDHNIL